MDGVLDVAITGLTYYHGVIGAHLIQDLDSDCLCVTSAGSASA